MKLTIERIEERALEIYLGSVKNPKIPEDFCALIYEEFIRRMKNHKERNPDKKEISEAYVSFLVKCIVRELYRKERLRQNREENIENSEQILYGTREAMDREEAPNPILQRISCFIDKSIEAKGTYAQYAMFFLLYYSAYIPSAYIENKVSKIGYEQHTIEKWVFKLREKSINRYSNQMEDCDKKLCSYLNRLLNLYRKYRRQDIHSTEEYKDQYSRLRCLQLNALEKRSKLMLVPYYHEVEKLTGHHRDKIRYGVKAIMNILNLKNGKKTVRIYRRSA